MQPRGSQYFCKQFNGIGNYPSVGEGQISPAKCADSFRGYSYRECTNGVLGDVKNDKCEYKLPEKLGYDNNNMEFVLGTEVISGKPSYKNIITRFFMQDSTPLPAGLTLNEQTGEITGKPIALMDTKTFTVRAENPAGETYVAIAIHVRKGYCQPEGVFERTDVGEVAVYQCAMQGQLRGYAEESMRVGSEGRRVAEGFGHLHARDGDCSDRGGGDCHHCCGGVPAAQNSL